MLALLCTCDFLVCCFSQYIMSLFAVWVDPKMVDVSNLNYVSAGTVLYQRLSVIATGDSLLFLSGLAWDASAVEMMLLLFHPALVLVDNIHFQYNGFVIGFLLVSVRLMACRETSGRVGGVALLAAALNLKQTLLYAMPVVGMYLLSSSSLSMLVSTATVFLSVIYAIWIPFRGQERVVLKRLFPFGRGLLHSYWAPNLWAILATLDSAISIVMGGDRSPSTRGLTGVQNPFRVLPNPSPSVSLLLTIIGMLPAIYIVTFRSRVTFNRTTLLVSPLLELSPRFSPLQAITPLLTQLSQPPSTCC